MVDQRRRRWATIETALGEFPVFAGKVLRNVYHLTPALDQSLVLRGGFQGNVPPPPPPLSP